jgi:transcriptional regulator
LEAQVRRLTEKYEGSRRPSWSVDDAPRSYLDGMLRGIVGIELRITRIEAKAKLSQNRPDVDVLGVIEGLENDGQQVLADAVRGARSADAVRGARSADAVRGARFAG